jgi:hypothetical protein
LVIFIVLLDLGKKFSFVYRHWMAKNITPKSSGQGLPRVPGGSPKSRPAGAMIGQAEGECKNKIRDWSGESCGSVVVV